MNVRRYLPLLFVLGSSYAVGRLASDAIVKHSLGLDLEFCAHVAVVAVVQAVAVGAVDWLCRNRRPATSPAVPDDPEEP